MSLFGSDMNISLWFKLEREMQKERKLDFRIIRNIVILIKKELKRKWLISQKR